MSNERLKVITMQSYTAQAKSSKRVAVCSTFFGRHAQAARRCVYDFHTLTIFLESWVVVDGQVLIEPEHIFWLLGVSDHDRVNSFNGRLLRHRRSQVPLHLLNRQLNTREAIAKVLKHREGSKG